MEESSKIEVYFFTALFLGVMVLTFFILQPFLTTLAIAAVLAVLTYPLYEHLVSIVKKESIAAMLTVLSVLVILIIPLSIIVALLVNEARGISAAFSENGVDGLLDMLGPVESLIALYVPGINFDVASLLNQGTSFITRNLASAFTETAQVLLSLVIGSIAFYYLLKDGKKFTATAINFSPLEDKYDRAILLKLKNTIHSVIQGSLLIAVIQGTLTGIGFAIFGVPSPALWGSVAAIGALIPGIGTALVIIPGILYLIITGGMAQAVGLAIWGGIAVGLIDNILLPKFMGSRARIHPLFILLSVLGGLALFGPSGFLLGPLVLSLLYGLGDIYVILFKQQIENAARMSEEEEAAV